MSLHVRGRAGIDILPEPALQVDPSGQLVAVNDLARALGQSPEALARAVGQISGFRDWLGGGSEDLFRGRLQVRRANGVPLTLEVSARRRERPSEGATCLLLEFDRQRVATEAQRYFDIAFESAPIGMALFNTDGEYVRVNAALCTLLGRSEAELLGRRDQQFTHPDDRQSDIDAAWRILRGEISTWQCEKRFLRADGTVVWAIANLTFLRDAEGNPVSWVGQFQDITARKALEEGLAAKERQTRQILETANEAFISIDGRGVITDWNPEAEATFGWAREEVLGRELADTIVPGRDRERHRRGIERFLATGEGVLLGRLSELTALHRSGREFPVELTVSALPTEDGHLFNAFLRDISERRRTEEALVRAHAAAVAASRMKSEFVANMSHEIRTPLNGVIGMSELLLDTDLSEEQREYVDAVQASGDALLRVIDDVLDFAKIEAGKLELESQPVPVRALVADVCTIVAAGAHAKGIELAFAVDDAVPDTLRGDGNRIRQVLANLLSNAVKFTAAGEVVVRVTRSEAHTTGGDIGGVALRFEVSDTGIGIEAAALGRIFDSFSQADGSTTRRFGGTGLGLTISKQLVGLMGGEIGVGSSAGEGSTFWFTLPLAVEPTGPTAAPEEAFAGLRALVVDDSATARGILEHELARWGIAGTGAGTGDAALGLLAEGLGSGHPYDLVLIDAHMPGMDGIALAEAIRSGAGAGRGARLVLLTSSGHDRDIALKAGIDGFVAKPVRPSRLHEEIARVLGGHAAAPAADAGAGDVPVHAGSRPDRGLVLVAEDNAVNQLVAVSLLRSRGFAVDLAANGREALERHGQVGYRAIFMDGHMPEVDGYEATVEIRRREGSARHTPIIAMTASATAEDRARCLAAGMDDYLSKPVSQEQLDLVIARLIDTGATSTSGG